MQRCRLDAHADDVGHEGLQPRRAIECHNVRRLRAQCVVGDGPALLVGWQIAALGVDQCLDATGGAAGSGGGSGSAGGAAGSKGSGTGGSGGGGNGGRFGIPLGAGPMICDPDTGVCSNVIASATKVDGLPAWGVTQTIMLLALVFLLALIFVPPLLGRRLRRATKEQ